MPEEEEDQETENLFEQIMKNFPNLVMEKDFQEIQVAQRVSKKLDPRRNTSRHIIIKLPIIKDERILKAVREKERVAYTGVPIRLSAESQKKPHRQEGVGKKYSKS